MEYNIFQHQDQTNFEDLHAQECTHMTDIAYHLCPDVKKKKKKKEDLPTNPPNFQAKRANKPFIDFKF